MRYSLLVFCALSLGLLFTPKKTEALYETIIQDDYSNVIYWGPSSYPNEPMGIVQTFKGNGTDIANVWLKIVKDIQPQDISGFVICEGTFDSAGNFYDKYVNDPYPTYGRQVKCATGEDFVPVRDVDEFEWSGDNLVWAVNPNYATSTYTLLEGQDYYMILLLDRTTTGDLAIYKYAGQDLYPDGEGYLVADNAVSSVPIPINGDFTFSIYSHDEPSWTWTITAPTDGSIYLDTNGRIVIIEGTCPVNGLDQVEIGTNDNNYCRTSPNGLSTTADCEENHFRVENIVFGYGTTTISLMDATEDPTARCQELTPVEEEYKVEIFLTSLCPAGTYYNTETAECNLPGEEQGWCERSLDEDIFYSAFKKVICWAFVGNYKESLTDLKETTEDTLMSRVPFVYYTKFYEAWQEQATSTDHTIEVDFTSFGFASSSTSSTTLSGFTWTIFDFDNPGWSSAHWVLFNWVEDYLLPALATLWVFFMSLELFKKLSDRA